MEEIGGSGPEVHVSGLRDTSALEADLFGEMLQPIGPGLELEDGWVLGGPVGTVREWACFGP